MIAIDQQLTPAALVPALERMWTASGAKIRALAADYDEAKGSPVFTVAGKYTARGWTEWTQGFVYGSALLQFDATGDGWFLDYGRDRTVRFMAPHVSHIGVHDHGFNNVSTYGNLLRLMLEGKTPTNAWERHFYELALKVSGAVQAARWTRTHDGSGFIHSFNGPHSLFVDTVRSVRSLVVAYRLGHAFMAENDQRVDLLERAISHLANTAKYSVWYGEGRDTYDIRGRTAHEIIFNTKDGRYRCPNSQQGYTGFSTWTRGLAWALCGFAEELEALSALPSNDLPGTQGGAGILDILLKGATATADFYLQYTPTDGVPYWDTGAPGLVHLGDYLNRPSDPYNQHEPVDSSAAAIAAQGLLRLGRFLGDTTAGRRYFQAGLTVLRTLLAEPYLSTDAAHHGLLLHSIYHRPNGWDHVPVGSPIPYGESSQWGDYHLRELGLYVHRLATGAPYYTFTGCVGAKA